MMKKQIAFTLCLTLLLTGCTTQAPAETTIPTQSPTETAAAIETAPPTTIATEPPETDPPVPETITATALVDHTAVVLAVANRGDTVQIVGDFDELHYAVKLDVGYGLIEKRLVRMAGEAAYEAWNGYSKSGALFCDNYHLITLDAKKLSKNTELKILDQMGDVCLVEVDGTLGYIAAGSISKTYIKSNSGGSSNSGNDGGDISLGYPIDLIPLSVFVPQEGNSVGEATVLCDNAELMLGWFDRDDTLQIVAEAGFAPEKEGWHTVYMEGLYGYVRKNLVILEGVEPYVQWAGYVKSKTGIYSNYYLSGEPEDKLSSNTQVTVLADLSFCYLVQHGEKFVCLSKDLVKETKWSTNSGSSSGEAEWSDPVM